MCAADGGSSSGGAGHLPNVGGPVEPGPPAHLPRQRRGTAPQMRGRYPDYDVLASTDHWDATTRAVVLGRVANVPEIRLFDAAEERALRAFCDVVLGQDSEPRIPVLEMVDDKLYSGRLDGFRYHDMPQDPETWKRVAANLDATARERGAEDFAAAGEELRHEIVADFADGKLEWDDISVERAWSVVMRGALSTFYSHPWAWNEIGFGGPAYPRGYARIGAGQREHWESPPEFAVDPVEDVHERGLE